MGLPARLSIPSAPPAEHDLRLEFRARNNILWHAIFDVYPSVAAFCHAHQFGQGPVGLLLNLKMNPRRSDGSLRGLPARLCDVTGYGHERLFPFALYTGEIPMAGVAEILSTRFVGLAEARRLALPPTQEEGVNNEQLKRVVSCVLRTLTPREAQIIRLRFGIGTGSDVTYEEAGRLCDLTTERIRQLEAKAIRKLRHVSRREALQPFSHKSTPQEIMIRIHG